MHSSHFFVPKRQHIVGLFHTRQKPRKLLSSNAEVPEERARQVTSQVPQGPHLHEYVTVQNHEVGGHLGGDFDLLGLQFCVHAEENVMCIPVVSLKRGGKVTLLPSTKSEACPWLSSSKRFCSSFITNILAISLYGNLAVVPVLVDGGHPCGEKRGCPPSCLALA